MALALLFFLEFSLSTFLLFLLFPLTFLLLLGLAVGSLGVFRYQEVGWLAREGSRWASVHGPTYSAEQGGSEATSASVRTYLAELSVGMNTSTSDFVCTLDATKWSQGVAQVTVTYTWAAEAVFGSMSLTSTASTPITY